MHPTVLSLKQRFDIPLYKNSFFMLLNRGLTVTTGFVFWVMASRLYAVDVVGAAVAIISAASMIISFSILGLNMSIIRFFNSYDKSRVFNTCMAIVITASILLGIGYISSVHVISPEMSIIQQPVYAIVFLLFVIINAIGTMTSQTFIAMRNAKYTFFQNLILTIRIPLLIPLIFLGSFGILGSNFISSVIAYSIAFYIIGKSVGIDFKADTGFIKKSLGFSFGNYVANTLYSTAFTLIPIIILNTLGEADVAIYYMAFTIGNFLLQVPEALGASFFVEGVYGESLKKNVIKSGVAIYSLLIPAVIIFYLFGNVLLSFFGSDYVGGFELLRMIAVSSLFYVAYPLFMPLLNIKMNIRTVIILNAILFVALLGFSYLLMIPYGITGVGYASILTYILIDLLILILVKKWGWL